MKVKTDYTLKVFPIILFAVGIIMMLAQWITGVNFTMVVGLVYCCLMSLAIAIGVIFMKKLYVWIVGGYAAAFFGIITYLIFRGADAGFGAFSTGLAGFSTADHPLFTGEGNFFTRLLGNFLIALPVITAIVLLVVFAARITKKITLQRIITGVMSVVLMGTTVLFVLTTNLRTEPKTQRMWEGQDEYLKNMDKNATRESKPNVLFILMDDLGYGDVSANGSIYETPNIDSIAENGVNFENFYSSYSVCSPARFAALTGRYPYRGYADNVMYPTISTFSPFAQTRIFNSIEMGNNCDGMLGDEITIAEAFQSAGYKTGAFGKWHLGDYGEYLPTNQGFDYFYGSHHVNDMVPFYHATEENGEYEIVKGTDQLKDQKDATKWIHQEITSWITDVAQSSDDQPFFAYYATPWPHAPVFVGDEFKGETGMGTYADCVTEFDYYLGQLFDTMEDLGILDDTIIIFTSDNGPALEGSTAELRGGKYLAYEGGQKVPFFIRWDNSDGLVPKGEKRSQTSTLVDLFPTLVEMCSLTGNGGTTDNYMPFDREIDGVSMVPVLENDTPVHTKEHPILHMKREKIKALQYTVPTADILSQEEYRDYKYPVLTDNDYVTFKYFRKMQNDNPAFFDKNRKNWLHILTDDTGENYNRSKVFPTVADEMNGEIDNWTKKFKENRRGVNEEYYNR